MSPRLLALAFVAGITALVIAAGGSLVLALAAGLIVAVVAGFVAADRAASPDPSDPSRRRFLAGTAGAALGFAVGGAAVGRVLNRLTRPDPEPVLQEMAQSLGAEAVELLRRGHFTDRSGDLQLILQPYNTSNYPQESLELHPEDPRSSHSLVWMYAQRVPIVVYAPGIVQGGRSFTDRASLADLAPTTAALLHHDLPGTEGSALPGVEVPPNQPRPKVIVTFIIDGGGWNVLERWGSAWPNLKRLMQDGVLYRNAVHGSFPAVTAAAHATIGTGTYPNKHGISGHNVRIDGRVMKAWGVPGRADPNFLLVPTLADTWSEETDRKAWIGEIGYQIWHLGMIGKGGKRPLGERPVAIYWNDLDGRWAPQNPELYRLPETVPPLEGFKSAFEQYKGLHPGTFDQFDLRGGQTVCCSPPVIQYQGDLIEAAFDSEGIGNHEATDLLYTNYKAPDFAGHIYNMLHPEEEVALRAVDVELGRLRRLLDERFDPGEYALIVAADHGQCPLPNTVGGVRVDPIQLGGDIDAEFGGSFLGVVQEVEPSEIFMDHRALADSGATLEDVAAGLRDYTYGDNIGPYMARNAVQWNKLGRRDFAAVMPSPFIRRLAGRQLGRYGSGAYPEADPTGLPAGP